MKEINLYWPVYKNLEKEIIQLANEIHFDDDQLDVYSIKIADLIFRCSTEIESIAKDLYRKEADKEPKNAGECFNYFENNWLVSRKQVLMSAINFYFQDESMLSFAPFNYADDDKNDYYKAYNAIKHDRVKNLKKANINILIRAMAALYLLNIYFKNQRFSVQSPFTINSEFDNSIGSDIFSIKCSYNYFDFQLNNQHLESKDSFVYLAIYPTSVSINIQKKLVDSLQKQKDAITNSPEFEAFSKAGEGKNFKSNIIDDVVRQIGIWYYRQQIIKLPTKEAQQEAIYNSSEYKEYQKVNAHALEKVDHNDIDALCNCVGYWNYYNRVQVPYAREVDYMRFHSRLDIVLNKTNHEELA